MTLLQCKISGLPGGFQVRVGFALSVGSLRFGGCTIFPDFPRVSGVGGF